MKIIYCWLLCLGGDNLSELDEAALEARLCCCLAVRVGENTVRACGRPAFGIWFSNKLREKALKKRLPFVYNRGVITVGFFFVF